MPTETPTAEALCNWESHVIEGRVVTTFAKRGLLFCEAHYREHWQDISRSVDPVRFAMLRLMEAMAR